MAKKMLVSLAMEGKFDQGGLHSFEEDDDILTAMACGQKNQAARE